MNKHVVYTFRHIFITSTQNHFLAPSLQTNKNSLFTHIGDKVQKKTEVVQETVLKKKKNSPFPFKRWQLYTVDPHWPSRDNKPFACSTEWSEGIMYATFRHALACLQRLGRNGSPVCILIKVSLLINPIHYLLTAVNSISAPLGEKSLQLQLRVC